MTAFPEWGFEILNKKQLDFILSSFGILYHKRLSSFIVKIIGGFKADQRERM